MYPKAPEAVYTEHLASSASPLPPPSACKTTKVRTRKSVGFSFTLTGADLASIRVQAVMVELVHDKHTKTQKSET